MHYNMQNAIKAFLITPSEICKDIIINKYIYKRLLKIRSRIDSHYQIEKFKKDLRMN